MDLSKISDFVHKSIKYNKIDDILKYIYDHYNYMSSDDNIKKYFQNYKYIAKYIYNYRKSETNILDNFIELITLLIHPQKYIKTVPTELCNMDLAYTEHVSFLVNPQKYIKTIPTELCNMNLAYNEHVFFLVDYVIMYFKIKKSKLYLKIKNDFKKIINEYFELINSQYKTFNPIFDGLTKIYHMSDDLFMILYYSKKYNFEINIDDIIIYYHSTFVKFVKNYAKFCDSLFFSDIRKEHINENIVSLVDLLIFNDFNVRLTESEIFQYLRIMVMYLLHNNYDITNLHNYISTSSKHNYIMFYNYIIFNIVIYFYCNPYKNILELENYFNFIIKKIEFHKNHFQYINTILLTHKFLSRKIKYVELITKFISNKIFYQPQNKKWLTELYYNNTIFLQDDIFENNIFANIIKENIASHNLLNTIEFMEYK